MIEKPLLAALNHLLAQASWARQKLVPFAGRHACFDLPSGPVIFGIGDDGLLLSAAENAAIYVTLTLPPDTPFLALQGKEKVFAAARIEGSADFAEALGFVLRHLEWDAEDDVAKLVGDIAAHRLMGGLKAFVGWQKDVARRLAENIVEYATEEQAQLLGRRDLDEFKGQLSALTTDITALEQRLQKLSTRP